MYIIKLLKQFKAKKVVIFSFLRILPVLVAVSSSAAFAGFIYHPVFGENTWVDSTGLSWSTPRKDQDAKILQVKLDEASEICSTLIFEGLARLPNLDEVARIEADREYQKWMRTQGWAGLSFHPGGFIYDDVRVAAVRCVMNKSITEVLAKLEKFGSSPGQVEALQQIPEVQSSGQLRRILQYGGVMGARILAGLYTIWSYGIYRDYMRSGTPDRLILGLTNQVSHLESVWRILTLPMRNPNRPVWDVFCRVMSLSLVPFKNMTAVTFLNTIAPVPTLATAYNLCKFGAYCYEYAGFNELLFGPTPQSLYITSLKDGEWFSKIGNGKSHLIIDPKGEVRPFILSDVASSWKTIFEVEQYCKENDGEVPSKEQFQALSRAMTPPNKDFDPSLLPKSYEGRLFGYSQLWSLSENEGNYVGRFGYAFNGATGKVEVMARWLGDIQYWNVRKSLRCAHTL